MPRPRSTAPSSPPHPTGRSRADAREEEVRAARTGARASTGRSREPTAAPQGRAGLGGLLRGPGSVLGGLTVVDGASRSLDRLSRAAERGADFLDRLDAEIGMDRAVELLGRLEAALDHLEGIHELIAELHDHLVPPAPQRSKSKARPRR